LIGCVLTCPHCGNDWEAGLSQVPIWRKPVLVVLIVAPSVVALFFLLVASTGTGSPEGATRLWALVAPIPDPESGQGCDPEYGYKWFPNGEWVLGISRDSHGILCKFNGGGTVVFKDSRGQIRCFFGHICGPGGHRSLLHQPKSLDELYDKLTNSYLFTEYHLP
jgi:hypothetical protein